MRPWPEQQDMCGHCATVQAGGASPAPHGLMRCRTTVDLVGCFKEPTELTSFPP
jgi:hypothetical protein